MGGLTGGHDGGVDGGHDGGVSIESLLLFWPVVSRAVLRDETLEAKRAQQLFSSSLLCPRLFLEAAALQYLGRLHWRFCPSVLLAFCLSALLSFCPSVFVFMSSCPPVLLSCPPVCLSLKAPFPCRKT